MIIIALKVMITRMIITIMIINIKNLIIVNIKNLLKTSIREERKEEIGNKYWQIHDKELNEQGCFAWLRS